MSATWSCPSCYDPVPLGTATCPRCDGSGQVQAVTDIVKMVAPHKRPEMIRLLKILAASHGLSHFSLRAAAAHLEELAAAGTL